MMDTRTVVIITTCLMLGFISLIMYAVSRQVEDTTLEVEKLDYQTICLDADITHDPELKKQCEKQKAEEQKIEKQKTEENNE